MRLSLLVIVCCSIRALSSADELPPPATEANPRAELETANFIDERVFAKLNELNISPSPLADDATFLRRLSLTTIGQLPTADEVRRFLADRDPDKRARKIDELLGHELHAAVWATRFSELTGGGNAAIENPAELKPKRAKMWHDWLRRRFVQNVPYDTLVRQILTATSRSDQSLEDWIDDEAALVVAAREGFENAYADRPLLDLFWRRDPVDNRYPTEELAERIAANFLGVRINCARCHNHPFDRWTQADYQGFVRIFERVRFGMSPELRAGLANRIEARRRLTAQGHDAGPPLPHVREVYVVDPPPNLPGAEGFAAKCLGGPMCDDRAQDPRLALMDWLEESENPLFARNAVNRVWAHHFGRGLVEPLDGFTSTNVPAHPVLLDELAADFVAHGYDLRRVERLILNSITWQLASEPNETNRFDPTYFSRAYVRIPPAETVVDMWIAATGIAAEFGDATPAGIRAVEIAPSGLGSNRWNAILQLYNRPNRTQTCDCGPKQEPSIRQTLALMSDTNLLGDLSQGALGQLLEDISDDHLLLDELFLRTVSRAPRPDERSGAMSRIAAASDRRQVFEDILWGLLNSQEFITNH